MCAKADHKDLNELCVPDHQNVVNMKGTHTPTLRDLLQACLANVCFYVQEFASCNSTVDMAPWRLEPPEADIQCDAGALPMVRPKYFTTEQHFTSFRNLKPSRYFTKICQAA